VHIVASYGPDLKPQPDSTLVKALAGVAVATAAR
jgi:hypothetical protein